MSVSYGAITAYGFKLKKSLLYRAKLVKIGEHDFPEEVLFDSRTGDPLWRVQDVPIAGYEEDKFYQYDVAEYYYHSTDVIIGFILGTTKYDELTCCSDITPERLADIQRQMIMDHQLKGTFGEAASSLHLWTLCHVS